MKAEELAALEAELRKDLEALERVRRLMETKQSQRVLPLTIQVSDSITVSDDVDLGESPVNSLRGAIESIINSDPATKWTTQRVLAQLQQTHFPLRAQKPIYSVGQALQKLVEKERIRLVRKGSGSSPNIYRARMREVSENGNGRHTE